MIKNIIKSFVFYFTVVMFALTICMNYDNVHTSELVRWFIILGISSFLTYCFFKSSTEEEIKEFTGVNFIKNKFGIDLMED